MPQVLSKTKHFHITKILRQQIKTLEPGDFLPTVSELKQQFGASQTTLDRALGILRREGLIKRPMGKQRMVVADFVDPASHRIALIRTDYPSRMTNEVSRSIVESGHKFDWLFSQSYYRSLKGLDLEKAVGGNDAALLLLTPEPLPTHIFQALQKPRIPFVIVQETLENPQVNWVCSDAEAEARLAVEHLATLGHRRILCVVPAFLTGPMARALEGWRKAMEKLGEVGVDELFVNCAVRMGDDPLFRGYEFISHWMSGPHPHFTGVYCATSEIGMAFLRVLREKEVAVPQQVSVTAAAGLSRMSAFLNPPLTSTEYEIDDYGNAVTGILKDLFNQPQELSTPRHILIEPRLVARASTGPCPEKVTLPPGHPRQAAYGAPE